LVAATVKLMSFTTYVHHRIQVMLLFREARPDCLRFSGDQLWALRTGVMQSIACRRAGSIAKDWMSWVCATPLSAYRYQPSPDLRAPQIGASCRYHQRPGIHAGFLRCFSTITAALNNTEQTLNATVSRTLSNILFGLHPSCQLQSVRILAAFGGESKKAVRKNG
jgi:hypothetical protein